MDQQVRGLLPAHRLDEHGQGRRILLVSPLSDRFNGIGNFGAPALGVWRLKANIDAAGHHADVWDCNVGRTIRQCSTTEELVLEFYAHMAESFDLNSYDWFGFSILNDTLPLTLGLANYVKLKHPSARQVAGNAEATLNYQDILDKSKIECVLVGEADFAVQRLLDGEDPRRIGGLLWFTRANRMSPEDFNDAYAPLDWGSLPLVEYGVKTMRLYANIPSDHQGLVTDDEYRRMMLREISPENGAKMLGMPYEDYVKRLHSCMTVRLVTMDHCFLPCTYCSTARIPDFATGVFQRSVFMPIEEFKKLALRVKREVPGVLAIYDDSDETFLGTKRGLEYAKALQEIKPEMDKGTVRGFRWLVQTRTNEMTRELVHELAKAGVQHLTFGVENASPYVRDSIRKRQDDQQILDIIDWCKEAGIVCYYLLILFPPETRIEDLRINVQKIKEWVSRGAVVSAEPYLMPYKGTPIIEDPRYVYEHVTYDVPFSNKAGAAQKKLKWPTLVWPRLPEVAALMRYYRATLDHAIIAARDKAGHKHTFKGFTGIVCVDHLAHCLEEYDKGNIRPGMDWRWDNDLGRAVVVAGAEFAAVGAGAERPAVYQEYADQESGASVRDRARAEAQVAKEDTMQSPVGRFNPSHSSIDESAAQKDVAGLKQGASKVRAAKDANAPDEPVIDVSVKASGEMPMTM